MSSIEPMDTLPCGHEEFVIINEDDGYRFIRCIECNSPAIITPDYTVIKIESIFKIEDFSKINA